MTVRTFLVLASLVLSVTTGLVLSRGGSASVAPPQGPRPLYIGLSLDTLKEARWQGDRDMFCERAKALGAEVVVQSANSDDAKQMSDVQALITRGVDVLVVVPHDGRAMARAVELAHEAGIPVIAYDRLIRDVDLDLYVSFDNVRVGELQARYVVDKLKPTPENPTKLLRIFGARSDNNAALFKQGQDELLAPLIERGAVSILFEDWAEDWKPENAKRITNAAITQHGKTFGAILAANDGTAGGAIQALQEEGGTGGTLVTGQDADLVAVQRIAAGTQSMTIYKPLKTLARGAAELAVRLAQRKPVIARQSVNNGKIEVPAVLFDVVTVERNNIVTTIIADGFLSYDDIYRDIAQTERPPRP